MSHRDIPIRAATGRSSSVKPAAQRRATPSPISPGGAAVGQPAPRPALYNVLECFVQPHPVHDILVTLKLHAGQRLQLNMDGGLALALASDLERAFQQGTESQRETRSAADLSGVALAQTEGDSVPHQSGRPA